MALTEAPGLTGHFALATATNAVCRTAGRRHKLGAVQIGTDYIAQAGLAQHRRLIRMAPSRHVKRLESVGNPHRPRTSLDGVKTGKRPFRTWTLPDAGLAAQACATPVRSSMVGTRIADHTGKTARANRERSGPRQPDAGTPGEVPRSNTINKRSTSADAVQKPFTKLAQARSETTAKYVHSTTKQMLKKRR